MQEKDKHLADGEEVLRLKKINDLVQKGERSGNFGRYRIELLLEKGFSLVLVEEMVNRGYELTQANAINFTRQLRGRSYNEITKYPLRITDEDYRRAGYR
jgi:hypothetical protein